MKLLVSFFSMFCEKLQNVCPVVANPDKMDKSDTIFGLSTSQHPQTRYKLQVPKNPVYRCIHQCEDTDHVYVIVRTGQ